MVSKHERRLAKLEWASGLHGPEPITVIRNWLVDPRTMVAVCHGDEGRTARVVQDDFGKWKLQENIQ